MWQSLIKSDLEGIKQSSKALGVEEMYGLLACILTARSWDVITTGIDQGPVTDDEVCIVCSLKQIVFSSGVVIIVIIVCHYLTYLYALLTYGAR